MKRYLWFTISIVVVSFTIIYLQYMSAKSDIYARHRLLDRENLFIKTVGMESSSIERKNYTILFWDEIPPWLHTNDYIARCPYNTCVVHNNRSNFDKSDAVIFYGPAHFLKTVPSKKNSHVWIFMSMESPLNVFGSFEHLNNKVNWTWTYRRDSDILGLYGIIKTVPKLNLVNLLPKNKSLAWFVSNCNSKSNRKSYANLMKKYIPVDIYGRCGTFQCESPSITCRHLLESTYNFYLSFENSLCKDYVTEKALARIRDNTILVVRGGGNYSHYLPPHSYIDVSWYETVQNLTAELLRIESEKDIYSSFHEWRPFYKNVEFVDTVNYEDGWCDICRRLHFQEKYRRVYEDLEAWWRGNNEEGMICSNAGHIK